MCRFSSQKAQNFLVGKLRIAIALPNEGFARTLYGSPRSNDMALKNQIYGVLLDNRVRDRALSSRLATARTTRKKSGVTSQELISSFTSAHMSGWGEFQRFHREPVAL
jgi:hypothetical protein